MSEETLRYTSVSSPLFVSRKTSLPLKFYPFRNAALYLKTIYAQLPDYGNKLFLQDVFQQVNRILWVKSPEVGGQWQSIINSEVQMSDENMVDLIQRIITNNITQADIDTQAAALAPAIEFIRRIRPRVITEKEEEEEYDLINIDRYNKNISREARQLTSQLYEKQSEPPISSEQYNFNTPQIKGRNVYAPSPWRQNLQANNTGEMKWQFIRQATGPGWRGCRFDTDCETSLVCDHEVCTIPDVALIQKTSGKELARGNIVRINPTQITLRHNSDEENILPRQGNSLQFLRSCPPATEGDLQVTTVNGKEVMIKNLLGKRTEMSFNRDDKNLVSLPTCVPPKSSRHGKWLEGTGIFMYYPLKLPAVYLDQEIFRALKENPEAVALSDFHTNSTFFIGVQPETRKIVRYYAKDTPYSTILNMQLLAKQFEQRSGGRSLQDYLQQLISSAVTKEQVMPEEEEEEQILRAPAPKRKVQEIIGEEPVRMQE